MKPCAGAASILGMRGQAAHRLQSEWSHRPSSKTSVARKDDLSDQQPIDVVDPPLGQDCYRSSDESKAHNIAQIIAAIGDALNPLRDVSRRCYVELAESLGHGVDHGVH